MYQAYENPHPPSTSTMGQPLNTMPSVSTLSQDRISQETASSRAYRRASRISEKESLEAEIKRTVKDLRERLDEEKRRADRAEMKVAEVTAHLKAVNEARLVALREASQAKEELRLYRMQLETAQREIYRAQDVITLVDKQRHNAEKEAAASRSKARQLNETLMVHVAREQAWREGLQEGLDRGLDLAEASALYDDEDDYTTQRSRSPSPQQSNYPTYEEPHKPRSRAPSVRSRVPSTHRASAAPASGPLPNEPPRPSVSPQPAPPAAPSAYVPTEYARSVKAPSVRSHRSQASAAPTRPASAYNAPLAAAPGPSGGRAESVKQPSIRHSTVGPQSRPPTVNPSENIRPISVRSITPTPRVHNVVIPPDNLIPTLDADLRIRLPPPHEFKQPVSRSSSPNPTGPSPEPLPIPAPRSQDSQPGAQNKSHHRRSSSASSTSQNPYYGQLNTPMSAIQEVNSQYTGSPNVAPDQARTMQHQRSVSDMSHQHSYRPPSVHTVRDPQDTRRGPVSSYAGSLHAPHTEQNRKSVSSGSSAIGISVQPPSQPSLNTMSETYAAGSTVRGHSPAPSSHYGAPVPGQQYQAHGYSAPSAQGMPGGYEMAEPLPPTVTPSHPQPYYAPSSAASQTDGNAKRNSRYSMTSQANTQYGNGTDLGRGGGGGRAPSASGSRSAARHPDDVEVRSQMSADSLTTPIEYYRYEVDPNPDLAPYLRMASAIPIQPNSGLNKMPDWLKPDK